MAPPCASPSRLGPAATAPSAETSSRAQDIEGPGERRRNLKLPGQRRPWRSPRASSLDLQQKLDQNKITVINQSTERDYFKDHCYQKNTGDSSSVAPLSSKSSMAVVRMSSTRSRSGWGTHPLLRLCGGADTISNGTSGWGPRPSGANASSAAGWGAAPPPNPSASAAWGNPGAASNASTSSSPNAAAVAGPSSANVGPSNPSQEVGAGAVSDQSDSTGGAGSAPGANAAGSNGVRKGMSIAPSSIPNSTPTTSTSWAAAAGKGLPTNNDSNNSNGGAAAGAHANTNGSNPGAAAAAASAQLHSTTSKQLEQLNSVKEALFSQDGWGGGNVKQDTSWDTESRGGGAGAAGSAAAAAGGNATTAGLGGAAAGSDGREIMAKDSNMWQSNAPRNDGTELWKSTLSGHPPAPKQPQPSVAPGQAPWGHHTPQNNTDYKNWGEEEDGGHQQHNNGPHQGAAAGGGGGGDSGPYWGSDQRNQGNFAKGPHDWKNPKWSGDGPNNMPSGPHGPQRDMGPGMPAPMDGGRPSDSGWGNSNNGGGPGVPGSRPQGGNPGMGGAHWGNPPSGMGPGGRWSDRDSPTMKRPTPQMGGGGPEDPTGTSLWAAPKGPGGVGAQMPGQQQQMPNASSKWTDMPMHMVRPGMPGQRPMMSGPKDGHNGGGWGGGPGGAGAGMPGMPPVAGGRWGNNEEPQGGNSGWGAGSGGMPGDKGYGNWSNNNMDGPNNHAGGSWAMKQRGGGGPMGGPNASPSWDDGPQGRGGMDGPHKNWNNPGDGKPTKEEIWNSKQFRILFEMGFRKEDAEGALSATNIVLEDALELLNSRGRQPNRQPGNAGHLSDMYGGGAAGSNMPQILGDEGPMGAHNRIPTSNFSGFSSHNDVVPMPGLAGGNKMGNMGNTSPSAGPLMGGPHQPRQHNPHHMGGGGGNPTSSSSMQQASGGPTSQPSAQQLRILVQQIQMAVQAGHLNPTILNQPLAPQTLLLLNQLLQQIKNLQSLQNQHTVARGTNANANALMSVTVNITKTKQAINNLQNQISAQQLNYLQKQSQQQQQQQQQQPQHPPSSSSMLHQGSTGLGGNQASVQDMFQDLALSNSAVGGDAGQSGPGGGALHHNGVAGGMPGSRSRLSQWKLKDPAMPTMQQQQQQLQQQQGGNFTKAPGTGSSSAGSACKPGGSSNLLLDEGPWGRSSEANGGWPDSSGGNSAKVSGTGDSATGNGSSDFGIPEFEPGKPWKGPGMKNPDEDPNLTPGSVAPTPLPIGPLSKSSGLSGEAVTSVSSSTWNKTESKGAGADWGSSNPLTSIASSSSAATTLTAMGQDLWGKSGSGRTPPGLGGAAGNGSGWGAASQGGSCSASAASNNGWSGVGMNEGQNNNGSGQSMLLLKNLTPQIDGSTLKTLCMQHGPLNLFDLYLGNGIAIVRYTSGREAAKAQKALNNCLLGNTTIHAATTSEMEVSSLLQQMGIQSSVSASASSSSAMTITSASSSQASATTSSSASAVSASLWGSGFGGGASGGSGVWGVPSSSGDGSRTPPSSGSNDVQSQQRNLNSFLPGDLLGENNL